MADDLGAVRRTPRPTGDRQTPETVAQLPRGATNTASAPVDAETAAGSGTGDLSPEVAAALVEQHGPELEALADVARHGLDQLRATLLASDPNSLVIAIPDNDVENFLELPDCTACGGTGKDDHATPFEAPLAVHFAGPPVKAEGRRRQLCMWCGHVLADLPSRKGQPLPEPWESGVLVRIEDGEATVVPYEGGELPPGCCALPDDEEPRGYGERVCRRCDVQAAFCPCTKPDVACGKHVPGTSSNRCLLRPGHTSDCSDEFEPEPCTCTENLCDYDDHDNPPTGDECVPCGQRPEGTPCCALDGPDEAQETRAAADSPAEPEDGDRG